MHLQATICHDEMKLKMENGAMKDSFKPHCLMKTVCRKETTSLLRNGPYKKDSAKRQRMQEGANFRTTLLLLYHTSDWLNQYKLPKLQLAVYIFICN